MKKNQTIVLFFILLLICAALSCKTSGNNEGNSNQPGNSNGNTARTESSNANTDLVDLHNKNVIELPPPNPVANGKKQSFTGITIDVPADWKTLKKEVDGGVERRVGSQSPGNEAEAMKVFIDREYSLQDGDMAATYTKLLKANVYSKVTMKVVNGAQGIIKLDLADDDRPDYLTWETFLPPDASGYSVKRGLSFLFPNGTYEKNKQQIVDILYSAKIEN